ncbi:cadherin-like beta sandwich domain-containing protein [Mucilaginibacter sp.]|uniref:cadherin-like beta sandwich domain-containing protein n=1 Tax=Mucilaginibacter sp. TaxID=1882438 RepID=UPI002639D4B3|nr:cadherin-like beta sandwich domain-containing protein [Mucilaginibacter sp.]MDB4922797.1 pknD 2 [Mucilaginibacter sp.]
MKPITFSSRNLFTTVTHTGKIILLVITGGFCFFNDVSAGIKPYKASSVATLNSFSFNPVITRTTVPGPDFKDYTATVPGYVSSIKVIPVTTDPAATVTVNGVMIISGAESAAIPLSVGNNTIVTKVTAPDGVTSNTYSITITRQLPPVVTLNSLRFSPAITTTTVPGSDFRDYIAAVPNSVSSVTVIPTVTDPAATVKINGITVASGVASADIALNVGINTITTIVTGSDGITTGTYSTVITRQSNAQLSSLSFNPDLVRTAVLGLDFKDYTATVSNYVSSVKVTPVTVDVTSTVKVNGTTVASGAPSAAIPLVVGSNTIVIAVTSADNLTNTYSITITRQGTAVATLNSLSFDPVISKTTVPGPHFRDFTAKVYYTVTKLKVTPVITDPASTVTINGVSVAAGTASASIPLNMGNNTINVTVTAADGITYNIYSTVITRQPAPATLDEIYYTPGIARTTVPGPHFKDYTATVPNDRADLFVYPVKTDSAEIVKVNGVTIVSPRVVSQLIPLTVGANTITTEVTSADGVTTNVYNMVLTRSPRDTSAGPPTSGTLLSNIYSNPGINKVPGPHFEDFVSTAAANINTIKISFRADRRSIVRINGVIHPPNVIGILQRDASVTLPLSNGDNIFNLVVTSNDGTVSTTYYIVVTRLSSGTEPMYSSISWNPYFDIVSAKGPDADDWTGSVPDTVTSIKQKITLADPGSTMTVNGIAVASGAASQAIPLNHGLNTIKTVITSANGSSSKTLQLLLTRRELKPPVLRSLTAGANVTLTQVPGPDFRDYTASVDSATASIPINAVLANPTTNQILTIGGTKIKSGVTTDVLVRPGGSVIKVVVTSPDDGMANTYQLTVSRPHSEQISDPSPYFGFNEIFKVPGPDYADYEGEVPNSVSSTYINLYALDPTATLTVNGASWAPNTSVYFGAVNYAVGPNVFVIVVKSADGLHKNTYKITITREPPPAHTLAYEAETAVPVFDSGIVAVHEGLSPNGDGIADYLVIDGITNHPDNKLTIINKGGALVYEAKGYDNVLKVFDGHSSVNGRLQQAGTYFYSFDYKTDGQVKHKTGCIILKY